MKHFYTARRSFRTQLWYGIVYHYSNLDEDEIVDYKSDGVETSSGAFDAAKEWADENGLEVEMD